MKSAIVYFSYTGNTKKTALLLQEFLQQHGYIRADLIELQPLDESDSFIGQSLRAFQHIKAQLAPTTTDLGEYDLICIGTPVWAFGPAPAVNAYLGCCSGVSGKKALVFTTYGSGSGNMRCLENMKKALLKKGASDVKLFHVQQSKSAVREHVFPRLEILFDV